MKLTFNVCQIRLSELHTQQLILAPWEVPIAAAVHGGDDVVVISEVSIEREPPDAADEYARLEVRYGRPPSNSEATLPYVTQVYGLHQGGIAKLHDAIVATVQSRAADKPATPARQKARATR